MSDEPYSFSDGVAIESEEKIALIGSAVYHWWAYNISMGADNVLANARQSMAAADVTNFSGSGNFYSGRGPNNETVTFIVALTGSGPKSFCVVTVGDTVASRAIELRDAIREDLKPRLGF